MTFATYFLFTLLLIAIPYTRLIGVVGLMLVIYAYPCEYIFLYVNGNSCGIAALQMKLGIGDL